MIIIIIGSETAFRQLARQLPLLLVLIALYTYGGEIQPHSAAAPTYIIMSDNIIITSGGQHL